MKPRLGLIVDGAGEHAAFRTRFTGGHRVLKTDGPRGHEASAEQIVGRARKQIEMLRSFACTKIVVITDFERRPGDYGEFVTRLRREFAKAYPECVLEVCVPNQMIENWFLADICHIAAQKVFLQRPKRQKYYDGHPGKTVLKTLFKKGYSYSETEHGPMFFMLLRFDVAALYSPSLEAFVRAVSTVASEHE